MTYQEFWIGALKVYYRSERDKEDLERQFWFLGQLEAHIANVMSPKTDGTPWQRQDFIKLPSEILKDIEVEKPKLSLKRAKELLGSKFTLN